MPFIPHSEADTNHMLAALQVSKIDDLYDEIPNNINRTALGNAPSAGLDEIAMSRLMLQRQPNPQLLCFIGAGAYQHHVPAAISDLIGRGEFYSAYTPYQAEASQGSLQVMHEYQGMISRLMAMDVANASLYDGASATAEAALMACRLQRGKKNRLVVPSTLHPAYRAVLNTILKQQNISIDTVAYNQHGQIDLASYTKKCAGSAAVILPQPNFFGVIDDVNTLTNLAAEQQARVIAVVNPLTCAQLLPPGQWGDNGADIACGEGQPLGIPLASGGPYFGFMCTRKSFVRQLPGRIVGRTEDVNGNIGYTLTLQAREQHIRRGKATSNICTNQGLMVVAASIYMQLHGGTGMQKITDRCHHNTNTLLQQLTRYPGVERVFDAPFWHEAVIRFKQHTTAEVLNQLRSARIQGGYDLKTTHPELGECLLICATETINEHDIRHYVTTLQDLLG